MCHPRRGARGVRRVGRRGGQRALPVGWRHADDPDAPGRVPGPRPGPKNLKKLKISGEIILSDNGSSDNSVSIAQIKGAKIVHVKNKGYGAAIKAGIEKSKGKFILFADADNSYDFNQIDKFYEELKKGNDLVQGCRLESGGGKIEKGKAWMKELQKSPNEVLLIGDTAHDFEVSKELNIDCVLIPSGHYSEKKLLDCGVPLISSICQVLDFIK